MSGILGGLLLVHLAALVHTLSFINRVRGCASAECMLPVFCALHSHESSCAMCLVGVCGGRFDLGTSSRLQSCWVRCGLSSP
jgi:hypothetical protein